MSICSCLRWSEHPSFCGSLLRTVRQYRRYENKIFSRISWEYFLQRLFLTRARRLERWREQLRERDIPAIVDGQMIG